MMKTREVNVCSISNSVKMKMKSEKLNVSDEYFLILEKFNDIM